MKRRDPQSDREPIDATAPVAAPAARAKAPTSESDGMRRAPTAPVSAPTPRLSARGLQAAIHDSPRMRAQRAQWSSLFGAAAGSGTARIAQRLIRHERQLDGSEQPVPIDIATIPETDVLPYLANIALHGAVGRPPNSHLEFEHGDQAALEARRDAPGFGQASAATLQQLLQQPSPLLGAAEQGVLDSTLDGRRLAVALPELLQVFQQVSASSRVVGFGQWAASKVVTSRLLISGHPEAAKQLLDYMNELREVALRLPGLAPGETIDLGEAPIPGGGAQTADLTQSLGRQSEVKTVREPILESRPVLQQLGDAVRKFSGASAAGGPYEAVIYASYAAPHSKVTGKGSGRGTTTRSVDEASGAFQEEFLPDPHSVRPPATKALSSLGQDVLNWLRTSGVAGTATVHFVRIRIENSTSGPLAFQRDDINGWTRI